MNFSATDTVAAPPRELPDEAITVVIAQAIRDTLLYHPRVVSF